MAFRDLHNNIHVTNALNPQAIGSNTTVAGAIIDTQGYSSLEFAIVSGTLTDGSYTPSMLEGDAANLSDSATVAAGDLLGTIAGATFALTDDNVTKKLGYRGTKRYVKLSITSAAVTTGGTIGAVAIQGHPRNGPAT